MSDEAGLQRVTRAGLATAGIVCAAVIVSHIFGRFTYSLLLPAISDDLVSSYTGAGFLGASYFGGYLLGVLGVTMASARVEPVTLLRTGLGLSALAIGVLATAPEFGVLASGVFFAGMAGAGIWIPAPTIATSRLPDRHRGLAIGALTASMGLGLLAVSQGTTAYRSIADDDGAWRQIFAIEAAVTVAILMGAVLLIRVPRGALVIERAPVFDLSGVRSIPDWALLTAAYTIFAILAGTWTQFFGVALEEDGGFSRTHINNVFSAFAVAAIVGALSFGRLSDRIGRDRAIAIACSLCALGAALVPLQREPFVTISALLYGAGSFAVPPLTAAAVRDHLEGRAFAAAFGAMTVVYASTSMVAAQLVGVLADARGNFDLVYRLLAGFAVVAGAAAELRRRRLAG
ncbi:MAG: MFS transporter [Actinomycetota bacterium]